MELLSALGLNSTIVPQFLVFMVAYIALTQLAFKPYLKAFNSRKEATEGNQETAEQILLESQKIQTQYEVRARELNVKIKDIFESAQKEASKIQEEFLQTARADADVLVKKNREVIRSRIGQAREDLRKHVPELSKAISDRLLGKETH